MPALFLDRDGVINVDHGYVYRPGDFHFMDGIFDLVASANRARYLVVVVTNQAGIGRGYFSEEQFHRLNQWMMARFADRGGRIDRVYFCPYHPVHGIGDFKRESDCRKPAPGMILEAQRDLKVNLERSLMIGDKVSDMIAGQSAGIKRLYLFNSKHTDSRYIHLENLRDLVPFL